MKNSVLFLLLAAITSANLAAQKTRPGSVGTDTGSLGNRPSGTTNPSLEENPGANIPIYISGKVVTADGSALPDNITIQRVCNASPHTVAYTDHKGHFNFQWGDTNGLMADASESGRMGSGMGQQNTYPDMVRQSPMRSPGDPMQGCELRASAPGFDSSTVNLSGHRALDSPDVGMLILRRLANVEGTSVSATSLNAPKDAQKAYDKGMDALHKGKADEASNHFQKAVDIYPKYATAWLNLGRIRLKQQQPGPAREALLKSVEADGKLVEPYVELGMMASRQQQWPDAAQYLNHALRLDPVDFPQLWFVDAVANYNVASYDAAERSARQAQKIDPEHRNPRIEQLLGMILVKKQDYTGASDALRTYLKLVPNAGDLDQVKAQLAQIQNLQPKQ